MEWLWGALLVPLLLCGLMCGVPMLLAFFGLRRGTQRRSAGCHGDRSTESNSEPIAETAPRS